MAVKPVLKMGDPRLLQKAEPVTELHTVAFKELLTDLFDTMEAEGGVGIAAPQIGVGLQVVVFGFEANERYPDAEAVPKTILINPIITPEHEEVELGFEGCLSVPGLRGEVTR